MPREQASRSAPHPPKRGTRRAPPTPRQGRSRGGGAAQTRVSPTELPEERAPEASTTTGRPFEPALNGNGRDDRAPAPSCGVAAVVIALVARAAQRGRSDGSRGARASQRGNDPASRPVDTERGPAHIGRGRLRRDPGGGGAARRGRGSSCLGTSPPPPPPRADPRVLRSRRPEGLLSPPRTPSPAPARRTHPEPL